MLILGNESWKNESSYYQTNMMDPYVGAHIRICAKEDARCGQLHQDGRNGRSRSKHPSTESTGIETESDKQATSSKLFP